MQSTIHVYEVCPRKDQRGVDLISDVLPFGRLWYGGSNAVANAIGYAEHFSRSHDAVIRVYDEAGNGIKTHEHTGDFKEPPRFFLASRRTSRQNEFLMTPLLSDSSQSSKRIRRNNSVKYSGKNPSISR
jgi:hypothetical protein